MVSVEIIALHNNGIKALDDELFVNNMNLKYVMLNNNKLKTISIELFKKNLNLQWLELQNNEILEIEQGFHTGVTKLKRADFASNYCINETILLTQFIQWSSHQSKFKDCYHNYAVMETVQNIQGKFDKLEKLFLEGHDKEKLKTGPILHENILQDNDALMRFQKDHRR